MAPEADTPTSGYLELYDHYITYTLLLWLLTTPVIHYHQTKYVFTSLSIYTVTIAIVIIIRITWSIGMGWPNWLLGPIKYAYTQNHNDVVMVTTLTISNSKSSNLHGPNCGGLSISIAHNYPPHNNDIPASGLVCPLGRRIGVPETTTDDALPW